MSRWPVAAMLLAAMLAIVPMVGAAREAGGVGAQARSAPEPDSGLRESPQASGEFDMLVTAHPAASAAGRRMLERGGSAIDAVIAAQLVLNLVEPQSSGIGGGGFAIVYDASKARTVTYDGREVAPAAVDAGLFGTRSGQPMRFFDAVDSGLSVGVPGLLRMLEMLHRAHGRLPWPDLFAPALELARSGFPVSPRLYALLQHSIARIRASPTAAAYFLDEHGNPWPVGHRLRDVEFADTLERIALGGADIFYNGELARALVDAVRGDPRHAGAIALEDLSRYRALERDPVCGGFRRYRVCGVPPPSSGGVTLLQALAIFERVSPRSSRPDASGLDRLTQAYRLAYADRAAWLADPDYVAVPTAGLLDPAYLDERAGLIGHGDPGATTSAGSPPGAPRAAGDATHALPSTSHLSAVDQYGNAIAMTSSIEQAFGSLIRVRGFLLNNQLTDFSFRSVDEAGRPIANRIAAGKRPRSSMAPTLVFDDRRRLVAALGSPGGSQIIQYVGKTLVGLIDWRLTARQAVALPNFGARDGPLVSVESGAAGDSIARALMSMGHMVQRGSQNSGLHLLLLDGHIGSAESSSARARARTRWVGAADPRREGSALSSRREYLNQNVTGERSEPIRTDHHR